MNWNLLFIFSMFLPMQLCAEEIFKCEIAEGGLFTQIELNTRLKTVLITDIFHKTFNGNITLARSHNGGETKFNVVFEYTLAPLKDKRYVEFIIIPILEDTYRIGMAGYIESDGTRFLDISGNDRARCY